MNSNADYLIEEVPGSGARVELRPTPQQVLLFVSASHRHQVKRWVNDRCDLKIRGPVTVRDSTVERTIYGRCIEAKPCTTGEIVCNLSIGSASSAEMEPSPDVEEFRKLVDDYWGE